MALASQGLPGVDFIDLGASSGGSITWAARAFGGKGVGVDMSAEKAAQARAQGHRMLVADARKIDLADNSVRFCTLMDFLEHLPSVEDAEAVVRSAHRLAREFVFIALPNFDNERLLREKGLKRYYADWSGHTLHLRTGQLQDILSRLDAESIIYRYGEVFDTWDRSVIPLDAPRNSQTYDPASFKPRPFAVLPRKTLYTRTLAVIVKGGNMKVDDILMRAMTTLGYMQPL